MSKIRRLKNDKERMRYMATASFTKEFAINDRLIARRIVKQLNSNESTIKVSTSDINVNQSLARSEELLKKFLSR